MSSFHDVITAQGIIGPVRAKELLADLQDCDHGWLRHFNTVRLTSELHDQHGYRTIRKRIPLYGLCDHNGSTILRAWRGLEGPIRGALKMRGLSTCIKPWSPCRLEQAEYFSATDPGLIDFISRTGQGLIRPVHCRNVRVESLIAQAALAFPSSQIVVISPNRPFANQCVRHLEAEGIVDIDLSTGRYIYGGNSRIVIATPDSLGMVGHVNAEMVFVVDPLHRLGADPLLACWGDDPPVGSMGRPGVLMDRLADVRGRLYGFVPLNYRPSRFEHARLMQMFGMEEYIIPGHGLVRRSVRVLWHSIVGGPPLGNCRDKVQFKRQAIWNHPVPTRRAARLGEFLTSGDAVGVRNCYPRIADRLPIASPLSVLVLVENHEQADAISRLLPNWPVAGRSRIGWNCGELGVIATGSSVETLLRHVQFDVVIRLDQGMGLPPWHDRFLITDDHSVRPLHLVDFAGASPCQLRERRKQRRASYLRAGWNEPGIDPDIAAFRRFTLLTSRNGGRVS